MGFLRANHRVILDHPDGTRTVWEGFALTGRGAVHQADKKAERAKDTAARGGGRRQRRGRS